MGRLRKFLSSPSYAHQAVSPWRGCRRVDHGCRSCPAMLQGRQNPNVMGRWGGEKGGGTRVVMSEKQWAGLTYLNTEILHKPDPHRIVVHSCDPFEDWQGPLVNYWGRRLWYCRSCGPLKVHDHFVCFEHQQKLKHYRMWQYRNRFFRLIDVTPSLDWILVTKRPENVMGMWTTAMDYDPRQDDVPPQFRHNAWLGISFHDQDSFDKRVGDCVEQMRRLRDITPVLFLEAMPLTGAVEVPRALFEEGLVDWITIGGEAGYTPCDLEWVHRLIEQADEHRVPVYVCQLGSRPRFDGKPYLVVDPYGSRRWPSRFGEDVSEWPSWARRQEVPKPGEFF